jgi:SAM-dependent methyltransferase
MSNTEVTVRSRTHGLRQIVRYNWPYYLGSIAAVILALIGASVAKPFWLKISLVATAAIGIFWTVASAIASHWIYDRSELYRWTWIRDFLPAPPQRWLNLHAGLDESSIALREIFPQTESIIADFFEPCEMSEPSIRRARATQVPIPGTLRVSYSQLPFPNESFDTIFLLFAAHEIRNAASREIFFRELRRTLKPGGTVLLVEHCRDLANFIAFGPGFFHFLPANEWRRLAGEERLNIVRQQRMTPFVRQFLLRKNP